MFCNFIDTYSMSSHCLVCVRLSHWIKDYLLTYLLIYINAYTKNSTSQHTITRDVYAVLMEMAQMISWPTCWGSSSNLGVDLWCTPENNDVTVATSVVQVLLPIQVMVITQYTPLMYGRYVLTHRWSYTSLRCAVYRFFNSGITADNII